GIGVIRSRKTQRSLTDIKDQFEDLLRFRVEPLMSIIRARGMTSNADQTVAFLEAQLEHDKRNLKAAQDEADSIRDSLAVYSLDKRALSPGAEPNTSPAAPSAKGNAGETLMPQLSDSFIDRLVSLTRNAGDLEYRQKLIDQYQLASRAVIPEQQAVAYDEQMITLFKGFHAGAVSP